ncbi:MAG TPA: neutral/alkaline non-lysosomal ceramidase N-terminal domain-containing protein [Solirubrobacteraceae bacterium]|nr:neutral/alkaline non-lysosomal ceramidase N-terminal domain-containing protein [Solirubrobacteraceae bacterium]
MTLVGAAVGSLLAAAPGARAANPQLLVGVGRADITPVTNVFKGGWSCTCAEATGQQERLYARAIVIEEGGQKVALVTEDLFALSGGMIRDAASLLPGLGFSEANIIDSATHTHSSQSGYMNFSSYNSILPSNSNPTLSGVTNTATDPVMYSFMTRQLALAIRRAYDDLRPGAIGWGETELLGITQNRSLGAHLADYGLSDGPNGGSPSQDPGGYADTIDPTVNVLRIDQFRRRGRTVRRMPVGIYSTFANHGTVDHENFWYYSGDHQGAAERVVEAAIRGAGHVPASQDVINAFANSDAGDMTSGIQYNGPADAEYIGRREASAMLAAWRQAGQAMSTHPAFGLRFTRVCMCGQQTGEGPIDSTPWIGQAAGAGSEEGRTIFYYDGLAQEGDKLPFDVGPQGDKITVLNEKCNVPQAVPFTVLRLGDRLIATIAGEPTVGTGKLIRTAVQAAVRGFGIKQVVIVGYAGDYLSYFTTPAEYEQQAYEGGFTLYGEYSSLVLRDTLVDLASRLVTNQPAPTPYPYDPNDGVHITDVNYGTGAASATPSAQPAGAVRLGHPAFSWIGGANGLDRPVDRAFVAIQRQVGRHWSRVTDDLGMQILWSSDPDGRYLARWEVPLTAVPGRYRFVITAKRYTLASHAFRVRAGAFLTPQVSGHVVRLAYPQAFLLNDWTFRPETAAGGSVTFLVNGRRRVVRERTASSFPIPRGARVTIPAGGARDAYGNTNPRPIRVR